MPHVPTRLAALLSPLVLLAGCHSTSVARYQQHHDFQWQTNATRHFTFYYEPGSYPEQHLKQLEERLERGWNELQIMLQLTSAEQPATAIHVFLVDSHEKKRTLMGAPGWGGAIPRQRAIFAVVNQQGDGCSTHEVCHVVANVAWGRPERWLDEGLATYSDERSRARVHRRSLELWQRHELPTLELLARDFLRYPESISYPAAGSFVRFVHERYGMEKLKALWREGLVAAPKVFHRSLTELEREWHEALGAPASM